MRYRVAVERIIQTQFYMDADSINEVHDTVEKMPDDYFTRYAADTRTTIVSTDVCDVPDTMLLDPSDF